MTATASTAPTPAELPGMETPDPLELPIPPAGYVLAHRQRQVTPVGRRRQVLVDYVVAERSHGTPAAGLASIRTGTLDGLVLVDRYYADADEDDAPPADVAAHDEHRPPQ